MILKELLKVASGTLVELEIESGDMILRTETLAEVMIRVLIVQNAYAGIYFPYITATDIIRCRRRIIARTAGSGCFGRNNMENILFVGLFYGFPILLIGAFM